MKSPEEIKLGLECCQTEMTTKYKVCGSCAYFNDGFGCENKLLREALEYIQQLERERDAAQNDLYLVGSEQGTFCDICKYKGDACDKQKATEMYCWEWRGEQEVE